MYSECYVDKVWPRSEWTKNTVHYVHDYNDYEMLNHLSDDDLSVDDQPEFDCNLNDTDMLDKLPFSDTEAVLLTALLHDKSDVNTLEIVRCEIADNVAIVVSNFLETNEALKKLKLSQNTIYSKDIEQIMTAIRIN